MNSNLLSIVLYIFFLSEESMTIEIGVVQEGGSTERNTFLCEFDWQTETDAGTLFSASFVCVSFFF